MIEFYYAPGACSFVPHVALELIKTATGQDYEPKLIKLHKGEHQTPDYLALNPDGKVPMLVVDGQPLTQILAIADYLDRSHPQLGLLPADPWQRAQTLSLLAWCNNTVHPTFSYIFRTELFVQSEPAQAELKRNAAEQYATLLSRLEVRLGQIAAPGAFVGGKQPSFVDAYALVLYRWGGFAGLDLSRYPALQAHVQRVAQAPAVATVIERERLKLEFPTAA